MSTSKQTSKQTASEPPSVDIHIIDKILEVMNNRQLTSAEMDMLSDYRNRYVTTTKEAARDARIERALQGLEGANKEGYKYHRGALKGFEETLKVGYRNHREAVGEAIQAYGSNEGMSMLTKKGTKKGSAMLTKKGTKKGSAITNSTYSSDKDSYSSDDEDSSDVEKEKENPPV